MIAIGSETSFISVNDISIMFLATSTVNRAEWSVPGKLMGVLCWYGSAEPYFFRSDHPAAAVGVVLMDTDDPWVFV